MSILREATKIITSLEMRIRRSKKLPFSKKYVFRLIRGNKRAKLVLNKEAAEALFPHLDHLDLLAKQDASLFLGVIGSADQLKAAVTKRMPKEVTEQKVANNDQNERKAA